jgi:hypothetical protein
VDAALRFLFSIREQNQDQRLIVILARQPLISLIPSFKPTCHFSQQFKQTKLCNGFEPQVAVRYWNEWCRGWESNPHDLTVNGF